MGVGSAAESDVGDDAKAGGTCLSVAGLVPDRFRSISCCEEGELWGNVRACGLLRSCAAEAEGRNRRRGATEPTVTSEFNGLISSKGWDGPAEDGFDPFCEWASVEAVVALPLRCRSLYFSIASASRSLMRVAIGDSADAGLELAANEVTG